MTTLIEAKTQISEQENLLTQQRKEAESVSSQLRERMSKLPQPTQLRLRQQLYAGLEGRKRLQLVKKAEEQLKTGISGVEEYKGELTKYETESLQPFKLQVQEAERQIQAQEHEQLAYETAKEYYLSGKFIPFSFIEDPRTRYYYEQFKESEDIAQDSFISEINKLQATLPSSEKLIVDWGNMRVTGVSSGEFKQSLPIEEYNKRIQELNKVRDLSRTDIIKDIQPLQSLPKITGFSFVSAQDLLYTPIPQNQILTTGSPIQYQSIYKEPTLIQRGLEWLKKDVKIPLFTISGGAGSISTREIKQIAEGYGTTGKTLSLFIPETRGQLGIMAGVGALGGGILGSGVSKVTSGVIGTIGGLTAINPELPKEERIAGGIMAVGMGLKPAIEIPKEIRTPLREIRTPSVTEVQRPISIYGKEGTLTTYTIQREIKPPQISLKDTGEGLLFSPFKYIPPKVEVTKAPLTLANQPIFTYSKLGNVGKFDILTGTSQINVPTSKAEFSKLTPTQQFEFQRLAEDITGRPVSLDRVPDILAKNQQYASGDIQRVELGRYATTPRELKATLFEKALQGKATTRYEVVSQLQKTKETPTYDVFTGELVFKDVTKPFSRAIGKTPVMEQTIVKIKEPIIIGEETGVQGFMGGGKKSSPEYFQQLYKEQPLIQIPKPIPKTPKTIKTKGGLSENGKSVLLSWDGVGLYSGSFVGDTISDYSRGFSKTLFGTQTPFERTSAQTNLFSADTEATREINKLWTGQGQIGGLKVEQPQAEKQITKQIEILRLQEKIANIPRQVPKEVSRERFAEKQILKELFRPIQVEKQVQRQAPPTTTKTPPREPPTKTPFFYKLINRLRKKGAGVSSGGKGFEVFGRRYGLDKSLGKFGTEKEAKEQLEKFLRGTLGAGGFVEKEGKKVKVNLGYGFAPSKKETERVIQERSKRLGTFGERREIKQSRKRKKIKWF